MDSVSTKGASGMNAKKISISAKRQITIPQKFYSLLGFGDEAECIVRGNELVIRPVKNNAGGEFAEQILADLIAQGLNGDTLLKRFKEEQKKIRPAVEALLGEASKAASSDAPCETYADVFGAEE